ncbi:uncharacterized protein [Nicotiana tomentosiformis]|uniref:uncharacterized protein n=1 Tax=Nicotiana tomentosiformis TaxID=4098 RepID=UPI00388C66A0
MAPQYQAPAVLPFGVVQPVVTAQAGDRPALFSEALLRLDKFTKLFPIYFSGTPSEDPHDFLDRCYEVLQNMGIIESNGVDFSMFQVTGSAERWWKDYVFTKPVGSPALTWEKFSQLFLENFLPITLRENYRKQFEHLQQGNMSVTQYKTSFVDLTHHALLLLLLPTDRERVRRFIDGLVQPIKLQMAKETRSRISFQMTANVAGRIEMVL